MSALSARASRLSTYKPVSYQPTSSCLKLRAAFNSLQGVVCHLAGNWPATNASCGPSKLRHLELAKRPVGALIIQYNIKYNTFRSQRETEDKPRSGFFDGRCTSTILWNRCGAREAMTVGCKPTMAFQPLCGRGPRARRCLTLLGLVGFQPTVIASRASPPLLEQSSSIRRIVDARHPSMLGPAAAKPSEAPVTT